MILPSTLSSVLLSVTVISPSLSAARVSGDTENPFVAVTLTLSADTRSAILTFTVFELPVPSITNVF